MYLKGETGEIPVLSRSRNPYEEKGKFAFSLCAEPECLPDESFCILRATEEGMCGVLSMTLNAEERQGRFRALSSEKEKLFRSLRKSFCF